MLRDDVMCNLFAYRYAVFVERLRWDLPGAKDGWEVDQFDRVDTLHVIARNADGNLCGCSRLLPTTEPYLLGTVFPELMDGVSIPCASDTWEISRFCSMDIHRHGRQQADLWGCREVMAGTVKCAMEVGARRLIGVSVIGIERILMRLGVHAYRAGPVMTVRGHTIFAFMLEIDDKTLSALDLHDWQCKPVINNRFLARRNLSYSSPHVA